VKILFVDNQDAEFVRLLETPFGVRHRGEIEHVRNPVGICRKVADNPDLRLIILDILWEEAGDGGAIEVGAEVMADLAKCAPDVPVVVYSVIDNEDVLERLVPEMMRLGARDWISKDDSRLLRSHRLERAFQAGRGPAPSARVLGDDEQARHDVHAAILFVDLSGFTALTEQTSAKAAVEVLGQFYELVGAEARSKGGYVDKYIGDAAMVVFGITGVARADDFSHCRSCVDVARGIASKAAEFRIRIVEPLLARHAARLAVEDQRRIGNVRVGMESGVVSVVRFERGSGSEVTVIGTPVNIAARILGLVGNGEVWTGQNLSNQCTQFQLADEREVEYRNLPGKFRMRRVVV